jgi:phosphoglycolate phosphatase
MTKQTTIIPSFTTVLIDFDGTLFDTTVADRFSVRGKGLRRFSPEWSKARSLYLEKIRQSPLYDGWEQALEFFKANNIQAAIVSGNNVQVQNVAIKAKAEKYPVLKDVFPKPKVNRIGGTIKSEGDPSLFLHALKQLNVAPEEVIAFGNQMIDAKLASMVGIKAYHCLWGARDEEKELMLADPDHECITSPLQIIDLLR